MKKILYIEDDPDVASAVNIILTNAGYQVTVASSGERGLALLDNESFDLLLLDIMLPDMSGWDIYEQVKKRNLRIAVLSVLPVPTDRRVELKKGKILDYITKPFTKDDLTLRVKRILETRGRDEVKGGKR